MSSNYEFSKVYQEKFNPRKYLSEFYSTVQGAPEEGQLLDFAVKSNIELSRLLPDKLGRALDFGCGPVVHYLMPVVEKIHSVVYSDYVPANLTEIEKWMTNTDDCFSFHPFTTVYAEAAGSTPEQLESVLRSKFHRTMSCDILAEEILPLNNGNQFDYIFTSLCIEGSCMTKVDYDSGIAKLAKLLKPGGYAMQVCVLNQHEYELDNVKIPSLYVPFENAKDAWVKSGCVIVESCHLSNVKSGSEIGICCLLIRK